MALSASTVWEVRSGGSDTNGGGFVTGASGTDWSQQNSAQYSVTDGVTNGTTTITSATANFGTDVVGNLIYVQGGTGSIAAGWYQITARPSATSITVDRSTGLTTGTGVTLTIGGALATPGLPAGKTVGGNAIYIKEATYTLTGATPNVSGGPVALTSGQVLSVRGYSSTRDDFAGRPKLNAGSQTSLTLFATAGSAAQGFVHLEADGNSQTAIVGFDNANVRSNSVDCVATNCTTGFSTPNVQRCRAVGCTTGFGSGSVSPSFCVADTCGTGFNGANFPTHCIAHDCTGDGFVVNNGQALVVNCTAHGNGGDGFDMTGNTGQMLVNCLATQNTGYGYNTPSSAVRLLSCANYSNGSGRTNSAPLFDLLAISLSGDPYVSAAGDDYRLNNTAGAGASVRGVGAGIINQTNNFDVGATQHADAGGGGSGNKLRGKVA